MKAQFSKSWKSSVQPRKQRKYSANAPLHVRNKFIASHLSKDLIKKHERRSARVRIGDKVKVMRGQFKSKTGKIERIKVKDAKVYISGMDFTKKDGSKAFYPFHPSNLMITELTLSDRRRFKKRGIKEEKKAGPQKIEKKAEPQPKEVKKEEQKAEKAEVKEEKSEAREVKK